MSMHPMRKPKPQQAQVKVDLREADTIKCEHCGNYLFIKSTVLKRLSALVSPTGEEAIIPIEIYSCGNCGQVPKDMLKGTGLEQSDVKTS
jgi:DNA-directed RNA polymerase subunit RPC12/RpoP